MRKKLKNYFIPQAENNFLPHGVRNQALLGTGMIAVAIVIASVFGSYTVPRSSWLAQVQSSLLVVQTNETRIENDIPELRVNPALEQAAKLKAQDMIQNNYFAHVSPDGIDPWFWFNQTGYKYRHAGENLATGFSESDDVTKAWLNSPLHKKNILNGKYTEIGIAVETGMVNGKEKTFVVQMFGSPRNSFLSLNNFAQNRSGLSSERIAARLTTLSPEVLGDETIFQEFFTETTYQEDESNEINENEDVQPNDTLNVDSEYQPGILASLLAQPNMMGRLALLALITIVSFSLLVKIVGEYRLKHLKHVVLTIAVLIIIILLYLWLDYRGTYVSIM